MEIKLAFRNFKMKCYVCKTTHGKFSFPKEEEKLQQWITSLGIDRPMIVGANGPRLCIDHFSPTQFTQHKNRTLLSSDAVPKPAIPVIPQFDSKSFSDVQQMGTKIIGRNGSVSIVHTTLIVAMSKFSPLLNRIVRDSSSSLESLTFPDVSTEILDNVFQLLQEGETITSSHSEVLKALELLNFNINSNITSYRIPPVQKQKQQLARVASCPNNNNNNPPQRSEEDSFNTVINSTIQPKPLSLYKCPQCPGKSFKMKSLALTHFTDAHLRKQILAKVNVTKGQNQFQCPVINCEYVAKASSLLARHLGVHHGETEKHLRENHPDFFVKMSSVAEIEQSTPNVISQPRNLTASFWRSELIDKNIEEATPTSAPDEEESNKIVTEGSDKDSSSKFRTLPSSITEVVGIKKIQKDTASQEVENHNTGVRVSEYTLHYSIIINMHDCSGSHHRNRSVVGAY